MMKGFETMVFADQQFRRAPDVFIKFVCISLASFVLFTDKSLAQSITGDAAGEKAPQAVAQSPVATGKGVFIDKKIPAAARAAATSALMARASAKGLVRVIAGLNVEMRLPEQLSAGEAAVQERALRIAQSAVVSRVLGKATAAASITHFESIPFVAMTVTPDQLGRLLADSNVVSIQEDVAVPPTLTESVPLINADDVWNAGFPGTGFTIAVLDTGVDKTHNMFPGSKIASEACYSTTISGQSTSLCPGGASSSTASGSGVNCPYPTISGCDHGTHVAGIAAGNMGSPLLRGVAKNARIISIQVFSRFNSPSDCSPSPAPCVLSYSTDQIKALERVYALRNTFAIAAVNMSLGGGKYNAPCDSTNGALKAIIDKLRGARIATVIASGNNGFNGSISSPACISSAIAVGSTYDTSNGLSSFSNHSANVRLLAPGSNIRSSIPPGLTTTAIFQGTSMATPHVAGAFALLRDVKGLSTVDDISAALECTGVAVTRAGITERRIDVNKAKAYLLAPPNSTTSFGFGASSQASKWTPFVGSWAINTASPGTYRVTSITENWKATTIPNCNESLTISTRFRRIWRTGQRANAGILFKAQLSTSNKTIHGYMAAINRDLPGDNHPYNVVLWRYDGVNLQTGAGPTKLLCSADLDSIKSGTYYALKVVSVGGVHKVYVNNALRCTATDRSYGTGRTGLMTFFGSPASGNAFDADYFVVEPNETVPASEALPDAIAVAQ
jgi:subtilisin family serine protease